MISFTAFKLFILIVYVWFAVGIAVISVFAIRELFSWFKVPNEHISQSYGISPDTQLIVFPELAVTGYQCGENFKDLAETATIDSTSIKKMSALAKEFHVHIVYGMAEKEEDILYNSQFFIDDTGVLLGTYRKVHLFDSEKNYFTPGDQFKVFNTKIGRIGLFICYDAFFPEAARSLAIQGVDLLVNSTNWEKPYDYDIAKQMKHDYYTMLTERRPDVYIAE